MAYGTVSKDCHLSLYSECDCATFLGEYTFDEFLNSTLGQVLNHVKSLISRVNNLLLEHILDGNFVLRKLSTNGIEPPNQ